MDCDTQPEEEGRGLRHGQGGEGKEGEGGTLAPAHQGPPGAAEGPVPPDLRRVTDLHSAEITREFEYLDRVNFPCALLPLFNNKCVKPEKSFLTPPKKFFDPPKKFFDPPKKVF